jgi:type IV pilus assembly protein PilY1
VGNGLNSTNGVAMLLAIDVETGQVTRLSTGTGTATVPNGLMGLVGLSTASNGVMDVVYAGDQQGRLWKFDLSSTDPTQWKVAYGTAAAPAPLFSAASGQPITARPDVTVHPEGGYMVTFGTGIYLSATDTASTTTQSLYGIWDKGAAVTASQLVTQSVLGATTGPDSRDYRFTTYAVGTPATVYSGDKVITASLYLSDKRGWKMDLPASGERVVTPSAVRYGKVIFSTMVPGAVNCKGGGDGWVMEVDVITGNRSDLPSLDTNADNAVNSGDLLTWQTSKASVSGVRIGAIPSAPGFIRAKDRTLDDKLVNTSDGTLVRVREAGGNRTSGRAGWEQIQ